MVKTSKYLRLKQEYRDEYERNHNMVVNRDVNATIFTGGEFKPQLEKLEIYDEGNIL